MTIKVWPQGCVCQAVRAPGSNVTLAPLNSAGQGDRNSGSMRTSPVKFSGDPLIEGCEPFRLSSIGALLWRGSQREKDRPLRLVQLYEKFVWGYEHGS